MYRNVNVLVENLCEKVGRPEISGEVKDVLHRIIEKEHIRVDRMPRFVAGSVFLVCRLKGIPVVAEDLSREVGIDKSELMDAVKRISKKLNLFTKPSPEPYINKAVEELNLDAEIKKMACDLYDKFSGKLSGRSPRTVAAALVYVASLAKGIHFPQKEVCRILGVTDVSLRNVLKVIEKQIIEERVKL